MDQLIVEDGEYEELKKSIAEHGLKNPIIVDQNGNTINGIIRKQICIELGIHCPEIVEHCESDEERIKLRIALNPQRNKKE